MGRLILYHRATPKPAMNSSDSIKFWKKQNCGDRENITGCQGWECGEGRVESISLSGFFRAENALSVMLQWWMH